MAAKALYTDSDTMDSVSSTSALPLLTLRRSSSVNVAAPVIAEARGLHPLQGRFGAPRSWNVENRRSMTWLKYCAWQTARCFDCYQSLLQSLSVVQQSCFGWCAWSQPPFPMQCHSGLITDQ